MRRGLRRATELPELQKDLASVFCLWPLLGIAATNTVRLAQWPPEQDRVALLQMVVSRVPHNPHPEFHVLLHPGMGLC